MTRSFYNDIDLAVGTDIEAVAFLTLPDDILTTLEVHDLEGIYNVLERLSIKVAKQDRHLGIVPESLSDLCLRGFVLFVYRLHIILYIGHVHAFCSDTGS